VLSSLMHLKHLQWLDQWSSKLASARQHHFRGWSWLFQKSLLKTSWITFFLCLLTKWQPTRTIKLSAEDYMWAYTFTSVGGWIG
jgi:hypothetical protein